MDIKFGGTLLNSVYVYFYIFYNPFKYQLPVLSVIVILLFCLYCFLESEIFYILYIYIYDLHLHIPLAATVLLMKGQ